MNESTIYSIGHGNKPVEDFINELKSFNISYLLDIRSNPWSKWNPAFNKAALETTLTEHHITYVFLGDKLGGLPADHSCYDENGKIVYDRIKEKDFFREGLKRLIRAHEKKVRLAVMCSESKPEECHRSKLVGQELLKSGVSMNHIVSSKLAKSQETVMTELTKGLGTVDLFGNTKAFVSRKSH
ncbi:MAG: DUF488 family protein [Mariniphaga sp.]